MATRPRRTSGKTPLPGSKVRGSRTGRPIMALLDLIGRRSLLRVLWELRGDALRFRTLQAACDELSPTVLNQRLKEMREALLVDVIAEGYTLTPLGKELLATLGPLDGWASKWNKALGT
jgi:DNA-binding HxlR family transcriptional regulator